jgi:hypothetical protein
MTQGPATSYVVVDLHLQLWRPAFLKTTPIQSDVCGNGRDNTLIQFLLALKQASMHRPEPTNPTCALRRLRGL